MGPERDDQRRRRMARATRIPTTTSQGAGACGWGRALTAQPPIEPFTIEFGFAPPVGFPELPGAPPVGGLPPVPAGAPATPPEPDEPAVPPVPRVAPPEPPGAGEPGGVVAPASRAGGGAAPASLASLVSSMSAQW